MNYSINELIKKSGYITSAEMRNRAGFLSNSCWCRHWMDYGLSEEGEQIMALQCRESNGNPIEILGIKQIGFVEYSDFMYLIKRHD